MRALLSAMRWGVSSDMPPRESKNVLATNQAAMVAALVSLSAIANPSVYSHAEIWIIQLAQAACFLLVPVIARAGFPLGARFAFGLIAIVLLTVSSLVQGAETRFHFFLLSVAAGAWLLHGPKQSWNAAVLTVGSLVPFVLIDIGVGGAKPLVTLLPAETVQLAMANDLFLALVLLGFVYYAHRQTAHSEDLLEMEHARSERLLLNVLPRTIAERLKNDPGLIAERFEEATVLFADIVDFTALSQRLQPAELVKMLDKVFTAFDRLADQHGLEKIKTIGDAYMVAAGIPRTRPDHAEAIASMALAMCGSMSALREKPYEALEIRIGIHTGPVVAGVIGEKRFSYDLWGDTVNTASRMESHGHPGRIHVTAALFSRLENRFRFEPRGRVPIKGKGEVETYFLVARNP